MANSMAELYSDTELQDTDADEEIIEKVKKAKKKSEKKKGSPSSFIAKESFYRLCFSTMYH